ncbi:hematopoietic death receptor isoform X2 [Esox lucius]|uniref:hematopoietic death receptor isoform X2 n=1 Tax=Esox lucius TaxID=8010 RepID=UPI001477890D|nr:hematopoietic death receptor isoform X2 [Esox lucius]
MSKMRRLYLVFLLILELYSTAVAQSVLELSQTGGSDRKRTQRDISCQKQPGYLHDNICCLYCPAGTYVKESCTRAFERGVCETCDFDTYTEHENGLPQCLKCTKCRSDQLTNRACTITQDTECQCKPGSFCASDEACEVCKKCSRCKENEVLESQCNSTSNTICTTQPATSSTISGTTPSQVLIVGAVLICTAVIAGVFWKIQKSYKKRGCLNNPRETLVIVVDDKNSRPIEEEQNNSNALLDGKHLRPLLGQTQAVGANVSPPTDDEDNGLGDSLPNTANSSQSSLSAIPSAPLPRSSLLSSPLANRRLDIVARDDHLLRKLAPLNGDESLKKCFELFEELDVYHHKRFFRHLGLSDNAINSVAHLHPEDKVYELLKVWLEKFGMQADMNNLIEALLHFDQRLSAENIISKAIEKGYYAYAEK